MSNFFQSAVLLHVQCLIILKISTTKITDPIKSSTSAPSLSAANEPYQQKQSPVTSNAMHNLNDQSNKIK